jgi:hypothetical protein
MPAPSINPRAVQIFSIAAVSIIVIAFVGMKDFSVGVDAGIHHAFATQLIEQRQWPLPSSSFLASMSYYPPAAHAVGAAIGLTIGSTFGGMLVVNAVALIASCLALSYLLRRTSPAETVASLIVLAILCATLRKHRFVVGNEIVANFFYGQFAGTAALLTCFVILAKARWQFPLWLTVSSGFTFVVGWFFPLSAVHLAVAAAVLRLRPSLRLEGITIRLLEFTLTAAVLSAIAFFHPAMTDMKAIAANDGGISISNGTMAISVLFLILLAVPLLIIVSSRSNLVDPVALIAIIIGVVVPPILQFALLYFFGLGSPYAVKKAGFLTGTLGLVVVAVLTMELAPFKRLAHALTYRPVVPFVGSLAGPSLALIVLASVYVGRAFTPLSEISRYQDEMSSFIEKGSAKSLFGRTVSINSNYNWHTNYVVSFAQLHPSGEIQRVQNALLPPTVSLTPGAELAVVAIGDATRMDPSCTKWVNGNMAAVAATCASDVPAKVPQ